MQDSSLIMMSPMDAAGEARLAKLRACIRKKFQPSGSGHRTKRALEMADKAPTATKTPRTKVRLRIAQASQVSSEQLFFQQFGSGVELMSEEFDLARPASHAVLPSKVQISRHYAPSGLPTPSNHHVPQQSVIPPTNFFSFASMAISTSSSSSLPAPSTATMSHMTHSTRIRTPRKTAAKRARAGEGSAEKALLSRKPRLGGVGSKSIDYSGRIASALGHQTAKAFALATNKSDSCRPKVSTNSVLLTSPSKFHFSSSASKLFSQRQAPRR